MERKNILLKVIAIAAMITTSCGLLGQEVRIDNFIYSLNPSTKTAGLSKGDADSQGCVTIPPTISFNDEEYTVTEILDSAFFQNKKLTGYVEFPKTLKKIGDYAFSECSNLQLITISNSIHSIGSHAFYKCGNLRGSLELPASLISIGDYAFSECDDFKGTLTFQDGLKTIGKYAFAGCHGFTGSLIIPNSVTEIGEGAFSNCWHFDGRLILSESLTSINAYTFAYCHKLTGVLEIPNSVKEIGLAAFENSHGVPVPVTYEEYILPKNCSLSLGNGITRIRQNAFKNCNRFTGDLEIPDSVFIIDTAAFEGCDGFNGSLVVGAGMWQIGSCAFYCPNIKSVFCKATRPPQLIYIDAYAFYSGVGPLYVPYKSIDEYKNSSWNKLKPIPYFFDKDANLTVTPENIILKVGESAQITAEIGYPVTGGWNQYATWYYSSDSYSKNSVKVSDNGVVTAISPDEGRVFAQIGSMKASCKIQVIPDAPIMNDIRINGFIFELDTITAQATLTGCRSNELPSNTTKFKIPDCFTFYGKTYTVTKIKENAFKDVKYKLEGELILPASITHIGKEVFKRCSKLTGNLKIPESVISIGKSAFEGCTGLNGTLSLPTNLSCIEDSVFMDCPNLTGPLNLPESITSIGQYAFFKCSNLKGELIIPNSVTFIGDRAFFQCSGFAGNLVIPNSVTSIGEQAFCECSGFYGNLIIPSSVTSIEYGTFDGCSGFNGNLVIPNSVTSIEYLAFAGCSGLNGNLVIPNSVTSIGYGAFSECSGFNGNLIIPNSVTTIGWGAFRGCSGFNGNLVIPNSVTSIESSVFERCSGLNGNLVIPNSVTSIKSSGFERCSGFNGNLVIPNTVTYIGSRAFSGCSGFNGNLIIPKTATYIGAMAFSECSGLTGELTIPNSVTSIGEGAFSDCKSLTGNLVLPDLLTSIENSTFKGCSGFTGNLIIPNQVKKIGISAFDGCSGFDGTLTLNENLQYIGDAAFRDCVSFKGSLIIPDSTNSISDLAFYNCSSIDEELILGKNLEWISTKSFSGIGDIKRITCKSIHLPHASDDFIDEFQYDKPLYVPEEKLNAYPYNEPWSYFKIIRAIGYVEPESISLSKKNLTLTIGYPYNGGMYTLEALVLPESNIQRKVTWTSSDESIVYVNSKGLIKAMAAGSATITATTENGLTDKCEVNVIQLAQWIRLDQTQATLNVGDNLKITATVPEETTDKTISWSSSDESVVTVDLSGLIYAVAAGEATVTATSSNGLTAECYITVAPAAPVPPMYPESITLDQTSICREVGDIFQLKATVLPENATNKSVYWQSSDESVVTVDSSGLIHAVAAGEATITASTLNWLVASCNVTITPVYAKAIILDPTRVNGKIGDVFQIKATVLPENATNKSIEWMSSNEDIATVSSYGLIRIVGEGSCLVLAYIPDDSNIHTALMVNSVSDVKDILNDENECYNVFTLTGILVMPNCKKKDLEHIMPGTYILQSKTKTIKVILK